MNLTHRPITPKDTSRKNQKLRDSAKDCPHCMGCYLPNPDRNLLCLAHSNEHAGEGGKGMGMKSACRLGAILCDTCHGLVDGRIGKFTREQSQAFHQRAHLKTVVWWKANGYL